MACKSEKSLLEQTLGRSGVAALSRKFGGQRIYIPASKPESIHRFVTNFGPLVGTQKAYLLIDHLGGYRLSVPTLKGSGGYHPTLDAEEVADLTRAGLTATQIAKVMTCEPRAVHRARKRARSLGLLEKKKRLKRKKKRA